MEEPVQIHSHGGRVNLIEKGEINIDVAFLAVSCCDEYGNASGSGGKSRCGSLGYAMVDAKYARKVVLLTESIEPFPYMPASIIQDQVDYIVKIDSVGDPAKISVGAARVTSNPRELMIARSAADVIEHSGYFRDSFFSANGIGRGVHRLYAIPGIPHEETQYRRRLCLRRHYRQYCRSA